MADIIQKTEKIAKKYKIEPESLKSTKIAKISQKT